MIYLYRRRASNSARSIVAALAGKRLKAHHQFARVTSGDSIVCWGEAFSTTDSTVRVLNGAPLRNKLDDIKTLTAAGIRTVEASQTRPQPSAVDLEPFWVNATRVASDYLSALLTRDYHVSVNALALAESAFGLIYEQQTVVPNEWLGRKLAHRGGADLLVPVPPFDFWVKKEPITDEWRIHSFLGKSIRAGKKAHRRLFDEQPHPWIRSFEAGWMIDYGQGGITQAMRELARKSVSALGLDFGAVDIGKLATGELIVLEVNRAPGAEGNTVTAYADAIKQWAEGGQP